MKGIILSLHSGAAEEKVMAQFETMLLEANFSDVFVMEVHLVKEGISTEAIQKLCDTHTRVLKKHLDLQEVPQTTSGHPAHTFVQENRELNKTTGRIRQLMKGLEAKPDEADATSRIRDLRGLLNNLMDMYKHHRRKGFNIFA